MICKNCKKDYNPETFIYHGKTYFAVNYLKDYCSFLCASDKALDYPLQNTNRIDDVEEKPLSEELSLLLCSREDDQSLFSKKSFPLDLFKIIFNDCRNYEDNPKVNFCSKKIEELQIQIGKLQMKITELQIQIEEYQYYKEILKDKDIDISPSSFDVNNEDEFDVNNEDEFDMNSEDDSNDIWEEYAKYIRS